MSVNWIKEKLVEILMGVLTVFIVFVDYFVITKSSIWQLAGVIPSILIVAWWVGYFGFEFSYEKAKKMSRYERGYWDSSKYYYSLHYSYVHRYYKFINDLIQWLDKNGLTTAKCKKEIKNNGFQRDCDVLLFTYFFTTKGNKFMEKYYNQLLDDVVESKKPFSKAIKSYKEFL